MPWADLLNHSCSAEATLDWDGGAVVFCPDAAAPRGEQLFGSYGAKSSGQLLLSYGFVQEGCEPLSPHPLPSPRCGPRPAHAYVRDGGQVTYPCIPLRDHAFSAALASKPMPQVCMPP